MYKQWAALLSLLIFATIPIASNAILIDSQTLKEQANSPRGGDSSVAQPETEPTADENRTTALKSSRLSPKEKAQLESSAVGDKNLKESIEFLAANQRKKGVISLPYGIQYKVIRAGKTKKKPTEANKVVVRYVGNLIDGTTFDKTDDKKPSTFNVSGLRPGLREAIEQMTSGAKWEVVVPPEMGFGTSGYHGVGPNAVLIYQIDLISIK